MTVRIGLTGEHLERLENGEGVEFVIPGLEQEGYNTKVEVVPIDPCKGLADYGRIDNGYGMDWEWGDGDA